MQDQISASLIAITRTAGSIASEDLGFHRSFNPEVGTALDEQGQGLLSLAGALLKSATSISELRAPVLEDADDVENNWRNVVDVVDSLLEKSDTCLDEYTGVIKRKEPTTSESSMQVRFLATEIRSSEAYIGILGSLKIQEAIFPRSLVSQSKPP